MFGHGVSLRRPGCFSAAPGRNTSVGALTSAGRGRGRGRPAGEQPVGEQAADGNPPPPPPRRLSKLFEKYQTEDLEEQRKEAERYAQERVEAALAAPTTRDGRPKLRAAKAQNYVKGTTEIEKKRAKMFTYNPERREDEPNIGVYGKGKACWWALRVNPGREKQVADGIDRLIKYLPPLRIDGKDMPDIVREAESWVPAKKVRAWSPKTGKLGNKALKYDEGGFLLVKTIMDKPFVTMLNGNINVLGFQDREVYEGVLFPRPASAELLKTVRDWEADLSDVTEEQVKAQLGLDNEQLPATSEPSLEEFFYDEDVEASIAAVEERELRRAERGGGRFGAARGTRGGRGGEERGRGRGGRFGASARGGRGRSGFFPADGDRDDRYGDSSREYQRTGDGWDRPPRRNQDQTSDTGATGGGSEWYDGGSSTSSGGGAFNNDFADSTSGWFTGTNDKESTISTFDEDIGWFGAEDNSDVNKSYADNTPRPGLGGGSRNDGGLLSDDDDEFWTPSTAETDTTPKNKNSGVAENSMRSDVVPAAGGGGDDDLDAIWGAGMGGGEVDSSIRGGWMSMDNDIAAVTNKDDAREYRDSRSERGGRGERRGGLGDRFEGDRGERGGRGRGRGRFEDRDRDSSFQRERGRGRGGGSSFDKGGGRDSYSQRGDRGGEGRRSSYRDNNEYSSNDSGGARFSGGDDLSWWDAPTEKSDGGGGGGAVEKSVETNRASSSSSSYNKEPQKSSTFNDGDDWFGDDFDAGFGSSSKGNSNRGSDGEAAAAAAPPLSAGTKVEVVSGRFQDFEGVIVESKGERVKAELDVFGTPTVVEISRGEVEPFES